MRKAREESQTFTVFEVQEQLPIEGLDRLRY